MTEVVRCEDKQVWDDLVHEHGGHPLQLWGWGEVKVAHGWTAYRLVVRDDDETIGGAQVLAKVLPWPFRRLLYIPRGPVWGRGRRDEILSAVTGYAKDHLGGVSLTIEPDDVDVPDIVGWQKSDNTILIPRTLILDLNHSEEELLADMSKKTRQYIRKSGREVFTVKSLKTQDDVDKCLDIYKQTAGRAGFPLHEDAYYHDVHQKMGDSSVIFAAYQGDEMVAFLWIAISQKTVFELYGGMNDTGQQLRANYMLKWHAIRKCQEWGIERYDMNGLLNDGVSNFKLGFASHEDMLAGTYDYPLSGLYALWTKALPRAKSIIRKIKSLRK